MGDTGNGVFLGHFLVRTCLILPVAAPRPLAHFGLGCKGRGQGVWAQILKSWRKPLPSPYPLISSLLPPCRVHVPAL